MFSPVPVKLIAFFCIVLAYGYNKISDRIIIMITYNNNNNNNHNHNHNHHHHHHNNNNNNKIIIATFILHPYPSREDVQGAYRSGYIIIGTWLCYQQQQQQKYNMHKTLTKRLVH